MSHNRRQSLAVQQHTPVSRGRNKKQYHMLAAYGSPGAACVKMTLSSEGPTLWRDDLPRMVFDAKFISGVQLRFQSHVYLVCLLAEHTVISRQWGVGLTVSHEFIRLDIL